VNEINSVLLHYIQVYKDTTDLCGNGESSSMSQNKQGDTVTVSVCWSDLFLWCRDVHGM